MSDADRDRPSDQVLAAWVDEVWREAIRPSGSMTVSQWADAYRLVSAKAAAEPGPWRTSRTPYLREIMDALSVGHPARHICLVKGTQLGGTEAGNNWLGYIVDEAPGGTMMVLPTTNTGKRNSKIRIDPIFDETPRLKRKIATAKSRDSANTTFMKDFVGGFLIIAGANSGAELRSTPVRNLFLDEVDAYPATVDDEGDPTQLAIKRTETFSDRKIFEVSSPKTGRIEQTFERSDQRYYLVPCPHCRHEQRLVWAQVAWKKIGRPASRAAYVCEDCGALIEEAQKATLLAEGRWVATATSAEGVVGYHLNALYSPWFTWGQAALQYEAVGQDQELRRVFHNTVLAETYRPRGQAPEWRRLYDRREDWEPGTVPAGGLVLTAGADVQRDRLEVTIKAWGPGLESWTIDHVVVDEDPAGERAWAELSTLLLRSWPHASGASLRIQRMAIDSGGHFTPRVYAWSQRHRGLVMAVKGVDSSDYVISGPRRVDIKLRDGRRMKRGASLWLVGVSGLKEQLYAELELDLSTEAGAPVPPGYHHHPDLDADFFKQLVAEELVEERRRNGKLRREWRQTYHRNEALDCAVYAAAAAYALRLDRRHSSEWTDLAQRLGVETGQPELDLVTPAADEAPELPVAPLPMVAAPIGAVLASRAIRRVRSPGLAY